MDTGLCTFVKKKNYERFIWEAVCVCACEFQKGFLRSLIIITVQVQSNPDLNSWGPEENRYTSCC